MRDHAFSLSDTRRNESHQCDHANASVLASAPVLLMREHGHVTRLIVGNLWQHEAILIVCPDCQETITLLAGYASPRPQRIIAQTEQQKDLLPASFSLRTVAQEVQARLANIDGPLSIPMLDALLQLVLSLNADGAALVGQHVLWNGIPRPIIAVKGRNITVPGNIGLEVALTCTHCHEGQDTGILISNLSTHRPFGHLAPRSKVSYTRVLNHQGFLLCDLERTGYVCRRCQGAPTLPIRRKRQSFSPDAPSTRQPRRERNAPTCH